QLALHSFPTRRSSDLCQRLTPIFIRADLSTVNCQRSTTYDLRSTVNQKKPRLSAGFSPFLKSLLISHSAHVGSAMCVRSFFLLRSEEHTSELQSRENL